MYVCFLCNQKQKVINPIPQTYTPEILKLASRNLEYWSPSNDKRIIKSFECLVLTARELVGIQGATFVSTEPGIKA